MFKSTKPFSYYSFTDIVEDNLVAFFKEGFIDKGALTRLSYGNLQKSSFDIWEFNGGDIVWQDDSQINIYKNNILYLDDRVVDYKAGTVKIPGPGLVSADYTFPYYHVIKTDHDHWSIILNEGFKQQTGGTVKYLKDRRVWLPTVVIKTETLEQDPLQLGGGDISKIRVHFHLFGDSDFLIKKAFDTILEQRATTIKLVDINKQEILPNHLGSIENCISYKQAILNTENVFSKLSFNEGSGEVFDSNYGLKRAEIRIDCDIYRYMETY